jgi:vacuolar-type H+-ATPase subunit E/Vma4
MKDNIKELKEKIIGSARKEAENLISRSKKAEERILIQAREEEKKIKEAAEKTGKSLFEKEKARMTSKKKMDDKKEFLSLRNRLFELVLEDLEEELVSMFKSGKLDGWIRSCASDVVGEEKKIALVAREEDLDNLKKICRGIEGLSFSDEPIMSGFLMRSEKNEYDFRFSLLSSNIVKKNIKMISGKLGVTSG